MDLLAEERTTLERFLPGLDTQLASRSLDELESPQSDAIEIFRKVGGSGLLVPTEHEGLGARPHEAIQVQRAIGARAPSLAVATTMHHFSAATLVELWKREKGFEWLLLQAIAKERLLLASGFAEGVHGRGVLKPTMRGRRSGSHVLVSGTKKPCSLSRSMDILTASVLIESADGSDDEFAVALVSAQSPGIEVTPFWSTPVLAGAQSDAVTLTEVPVDEDLVITVDTAAASELDDLQAAGFLWFELLITASYVGIASALAERLLRAERGEASARVAVAAELESTMASLESIAQRLEEGAATDPDLLVRALLCRYAAQDAIGRAVRTATEQLGGMAFIEGSTVGLLSAASNALAFHPPGRNRTADGIAKALTGAELTLAQ